VQLALADTYASQAASNPGHLEEAHRIYERLLDLPTASIDLRVEAGHKLGLSLSRHNRPESAMRVWGLVIGLLTQSDKKPVTFSAQGRYWMARTLLRFGDLLRAQGRIEQAREAYELVLRTQLPGVNAAQDALNSLSPGRPTP
jgi:tetratricopeptide (TPR) repeat protein